MGLSYTSNRGLFSDHYLAIRLPKLTEWQSDYGPLRTRLSALLSEKADALPTLNEAQTEQQFIRPVLKELGWKHEVQITFRALGRDYRPDYALFFSDELLREARATVSSREEPCRQPYLEKVAALAEAKYWERPLEARRADDTRDRLSDRGRSPHFQIIDYLRDSGVRWGILTNGSAWRLYLAGAETAEILYYEADLKGILESGDPDDFKRFCLFFRKAAFEPDETGRCFLDRLREGSQQYAAQVEDSLKKRVFDSVAPAIAEGFLHNLREQSGIELGPDDRETLNRIYGGTLLLLYRLFFLLYAEARDLIAVGDDAGYRAKSLGHLKEEVYRAVRDSVALGTTSTDWWDDLRNLFRIINQGDSGLSVPRYNGGLFAPDGLGDPDIKPAAEFLEANAIADRYLAEALMLLTRHGEVEGDYTRPEFIDFRDLGVRHLGSVYEGLLEFKLNIADTHLLEASEKGKPVWKPTDDHTEADKAPGDLYLTNDKHERKATGSYYTPDYIVRYIVENTVGPQIDRIEREYALVQEINLMGSSGVSPERPWSEILEEVLEGKPEDESGSARKLWDALKSDAERRQFLLNQLEGVQPEHAYDPPTRVLELKVLDPALGSGHFLVGALDYMTTRLAAMLNKYAGSPVFERIWDDRRKIVESLREQGIEADEGKLTDENLLRRMVMKRCLYGVDLNPLAVELSKLSLWLHAFTAGAPLSFLDHHVKCGDSLIGSKLEDLRREARKAGGLWSLPLGPLERAVEHMLTVAELSDASFEDVERSREEYWQADARVEGYRAMLDSLTAEHFGVENASHFIQFGRDIDLEKFEDSITKLSQEDQERLELARQVARERRFFHWEVEFPEVFFQRQGQGVEKKTRAGFDAVVGNPPYVSFYSRESQKATTDAEAYFGVAFAGEISGRVNTYLLFSLQALRLSRPSGAAAFIVPDTFAYNESYEQTRRYILQNYGFRSVLYLDFPVFDDPHVRCVIPVFAKLPRSAVHLLKAQEPQQVAGTPKCAEIDRNQIMSFACCRFPTAEPRELLLSQKISSESLRLDSLCNVRDGINPGPRSFREQIVFHAPHAPEKAEPLARGSDVHRYSVDEPKLQVLYDASLLTRDLRQQGASFREKWIFEGTKLISRQTADRLVFAYHQGTLYGLNSCHFTHIEEPHHSLRFLGAVLNSRLLTWHHRTQSMETRDVFPQVHTSSLRLLPIRRIFFTTPEERRQARRDEVVAAYHTQERNFDEILQDVEPLLPRNADGELVAFANSISMADALEKGYIDEIPDYLDEHAPSGYDADGKPLEHSDVVHDFLGFLAERMMQMHKEKQALWDTIRRAFLNKGVDP
ncbi:MAG: N-6 DNA methylase, partial [Planctomycetes bacterium]|nr:N-6 DNA methylase [Planctomycetota bacterium]